MLVTKREDLINPRVWITNTLTTEATYNGMIVAVNSDGEYNGVYYLTNRKAITDDNYSAYQSALAAEEDVSSYFSMWTKLGTLDDLAEIEADLRRQIGVVPEGKTLIEMVAALESVGAEKNLIALIDETQFAIDENRKLTLLDIAENKITGLTNAAGEAVTLKNLLDSKVDKIEGGRLLTPSEADKLSKLIIDDNGNVTVSGNISVENVIGLTDLLKGKVNVVDGMGLSSNDFTDSLLDKLTNIESGAQVNVLEVVKMAGVALNVVDKSVDIPMATNNLLGVVMGSDAENKVSVTEDGTMEVNNVNVNKLVQDEDTTLVLNGGSASA
jgi:hypothetical protein